MRIVITLRHADGRALAGMSIDDQHPDAADTVERWIGRATHGRTVTVTCGGRERTFPILSLPRAPVIDLAAARLMRDLRRTLLEANNGRHCD